MSETNIVFEVYSDETVSAGGTVGQDMAIFATAIIKLLRSQGLNAYVYNVGLPNGDGFNQGALWAAAHGVPEATQDIIDSCEIWLRAWPPGTWPTRPTSPRVVVDFVKHAEDRSHEADFVVAFELDDSSGVSGLLAWDVLAAIHVEANEQARDVQANRVYIHLGQDNQTRLQNIRDAIESFAGMAATGLLYPNYPTNDGLEVTHTPWVQFSQAELVIVASEFPTRLAGAMGIPAVLLANTDDEEARALELVERAHASFYYLGKLADLTDAVIRDAARDLRNDIGAQRITKLGGYQQRWNQGVKRLVSWISRELIGRELFEDPYHIQGYNTVTDPLIMETEHGDATITGELPGAQEAEVDVQVFTADGVWTKPDGAKFVHVRLIGAGGGGGSGRRGAAGTVRGGGGGGAGGAANELFIPASSLPPTVNVVVGVGGAGAVGAAADNTSGTAGTDGTPSTFGDFLQGNEGLGGGGGTAISGTGGSVNAINNQSHLGPTTGVDGTGGAGGTGGAVASSGTNNSFASAGGAGGGGGIDAANAGENGGAGSVSASPQRAVPLTGGTAGTAAAQDGGSGASAESNNVQGGGGAGGGASHGVAPGMGGAGGYPGGGGGGGSASLNGTASGAGGQGASGLVVVTTFF